MKCLNPPFSACTADHVIVLGSRTCGLPSKSVIVTPFCVTVTSSPSSTKITLRVSLKIAVTSDATKFSSSPIPTTSGDEFFAATSVPGSLSFITTNA